MKNFIYFKLITSHNKFKYIFFYYYLKTMVAKTVTKINCEKGKQIIKPASHNPTCNLYLKMMLFWKV